MQSFNNIINIQILNLPLYKFIGAFIIFLLFLFARKIFTLTIIKTATIFVKKTKTKIDDKILNSLIKPLDFLFIIFGLHIASIILNIDKYIILFTKSMLIFALFWFLFNLTKSFEKDILNFFNKIFESLYYFIR